MDANFTKTPWVAMPSSEFEDMFDVISPDDKDSDFDIHIADVHGGLGEEGPANAYLIAAAPEMFAALTEAEACMSIVEPRSDKAEYLRILGAIRTALSKARGDTR